MKKTIITILIISIITLTGCTETGKAINTEDTTTLEPDQPTNASATAKCLNGTTVTCTGTACYAKDASQNDDGTFTDGLCGCGLEQTKCPTPVAK